MTIDILCRVVDNFGDIGFVYRLAKALSAEPEAPELRLIVDDLSAFSRLCPDVDALSSWQTVRRWKLAPWDTPGPQALAEFRAQPPSHAIECYACGRPDWYEALLFDPALTDAAHVVNLEYFTCESWARDFHLLPSLTRSPRVKKWIFMPGIEEGTGGLLRDKMYDELLDSCAVAEGRRAVRTALLETLGLSTGTALGAGSASARPSSAAPFGDPADLFWAAVFSYEHDFSSIVSDFASFNRERPLAVFLAAGRSASGFVRAWEKAGKPFMLVELPFLAQEAWDRLQCASDFCIVRGEETFARAILAGKPFLWECYPFSSGGRLSGGRLSGGQLPKVHAFLSIMERLLPPDAFSAYRSAMLSFNRAGSSIEPVDLGADAVEIAEGALLEVLRSDFSGGFEKLARNARNRGNLASKLLTFMRDLR